MDDFYLYVALMLGTFLEGEASIITASVAANRSILNPFTVGLVALIGVQLTDWLYFLIGRFGGRAYLNKRPKLNHRISGVTKYVDSSNLILIGYRFLYGMRTILPIAIGLSEVSISKFALYSLISGILWSVIYTLIGYYFGELFTVIVENFKTYDLQIIICLTAVIAIIVVSILKFRKNANP